MPASTVTIDGLARAREPALAQAQPPVDSVVGPGPGGTTGMSAASARGTVPASAEAMAPPSLHGSGENAGSRYDVSEQARHASHTWDPSGSVT